MKKVLIASPTADIKDYCFDLWMENVSKFTYENSELFLCDNSNTRDYFFDIKKRYEHLGDFFNVSRITPSQYEKFNLTYKSILAKSHEKCRLYAIENNFDYLLHLETDVFPPADVIERLLDASNFEYKLIQDPILDCDGNYCYSWNSSFHICFGNIQVV